MTSCIGSYDVGELVISFESVKRGSCWGLASLLLLVVRLGFGSVFLNPRLPNELLFGTTGSLGFAFEPLVAFWKMRCFVLRALPVATLCGSRPITLILGCGFEKVFAEEG